MRQRNDEEAIRLSDEIPNDPPEPERTTSFEPDVERLPAGAVAITTLLAVVILLLWFGIYAISLVRS